MDKQALIRTPLADSQALRGHHSLFELPLCGKLNLRGNASDQNFVEAVEKSLGLKLPVQANTLSTADETSFFWLGPDEWLIQLPLDEVSGTAQALSDAIADQHHAITDVSDYFTVIHLSGPCARSALASASPFDIRTDQFKQGDCAQTRFGHASVLLWVLDETPSYALQVRWSYAQYVYDYLVQSIANAENVAALNLDQ